MLVFTLVFTQNYPDYGTGCQMYIQNKFCIYTVRPRLVAFGTLRKFLLLIHRAAPRDPHTRERQKRLPHF
jgi:hypothetical protein